MTTETTVSNLTLNDLRDLIRTGIEQTLLGLTPQKLHIIWDGASIPRSQAVKNW